MANLKQQAKKLLAEHWLPSHEQHRLHSALKGVLYELRKLQLYQVCVAGAEEQRDLCDYQDLNALIIEVINRMASCQPLLRR